MGKWHGRISQATVLAALAILFVPAAGATTLAELTFDDMTDRSTVVVVARVGSQRVLRAPPGSVSTWETHSELTVDRYLKGTGPSVLVLRQLGNLVDPAAERIVDDARLQPGERVVLLLRAPRDGLIHLTLLGYSAYSLRHAGGVTHAIPHAQLPDHSSGSPAAPTAPRPELSTPDAPALGTRTTLSALERYFGARP